MNLIVVESPTKARTLKRFLGDEYSLEATMGHIKDLPKEKLSVDVDNNFEPIYVVVEKKKDSIEKIKKEAKKSENIYIATDPDREGEAIAAHVAEVLHEAEKHSFSLHRIVFHEITKDAVEEAITHPRGIDKNLVEAQIARRVLDRLVGYKLSPLLWKKVRRGLSAGRVQSVAVRLIVEREREIEAFVPDEYWEIFCEVKGKRQEINAFVIQLTKIGEKKAEVKNRQEADKIVADLKKADYKVQDVKNREVKKRPFPPFTTSTLTQTAARFYGWSAKKTMSVAQRLYEEGLITYHRTDSTSLSSQAVGNARSYIEKNYGKDYLPESSRIYKTKSKVAQEAHEAIRPTDVNAKGEIRVAKFKADAEKLYDIIWKRFVACQMADSLYDETRIDVEAKSIVKSQLSKVYLLRATGQVMKFDGWRKVIPASTRPLVGRGGPPLSDEEPQLPKVEKDEALDLLKVDPQQKFTQPPARYNEASLIKTLEKLGIGRPSTYAPTISTIQVRQYVEKEEGRFKPTNVGIAVNGFLIKNFPDIFDYQFTAEMEDDLDNIANGDREWRKMIKSFYNPFEKKLDKVSEKAKRVKIETEKVGRKCPTCEKEGRTGDKQGDLVIRVGRFGKFISCSNFPECKHTEKYVEKIGMNCPKCKKGEVIVKTTRKGRKFYGCSRYPECEWASWKKPNSGNNKSAS